MPDNVTLTISDINLLKNQGSTTARLNARNFIVLEPKKDSTPRVLPVIADGLNEQGMQVFCATVQHTHKGKGYSSIEIPLNNFTVSNPALFVSLSGDTATFKKYKFLAYAQKNANSVTVTIDALANSGISRSKSVPVTVNLLAIGYV